MSETAPEAALPREFKALVGMNYVPEGEESEVRIEPGELCTGLPMKAVKHLLAQGSIEEVK